MRIRNEKSGAALYAGVGSTDITPPLGSELYGYYPHPVAESIVDRLTAFALSLTYGDLKAILFSLPVCLISNGLADRARREIAAITGVDSAFIFLCATHTHSGPKTDSLPEHGAIDAEYCENIFLPALCQAALDAVNAEAAAEVGIADGESRVGVNRRHIDEHGEVSLGQNPWGTFDPTMTVISFRNKETRAQIMNVVHYGAHNTAAGVFRHVTRDWCGIMCDRLAANSGAPAMFINGSEGDVAPRISNGGSNGRKPDNMAFVNEVGNLAALDAVRVWRSIREYRDMPLDFATGEVSLEYESSDGALKFGQTLMRLGNAVFIPFPFEFFSSISLRMREFCPARHTLCMGATNGSNNYLPSKDQIPLGGYEVRMFKSRGEHTLRSDAADEIIKENMRLVSELYE